VKREMSGKLSKKKSKFTSIQSVICGGREECTLQQSQRETEKKKKLRDRLKRVYKRYSQEEKIGQALVTERALIENGKKNGGFRTSNKNQILKKEVGKKIISVAQT